MYCFVQTACRKTCVKHLKMRCQHSASTATPVPLCSFKKILKYECDYGSSLVIRCLCLSLASVCCIILMLSTFITSTKVRGVKEGCKVVNFRRIEREKKKGEIKMEPKYEQVDRMIRGKPRVRWKI